MNKTHLASLVFKKLVMAVTGIALVGFLITHLAANLLIVKADGTAFNTYAHKLASFGGLLYLAEIGLAIFFLYHAFTGIRLALRARTARGQKYAVAKSKGGQSKWGLASNNMVISGSAILVFLVLHVWHMKFGPGIDQGYTTELAGEEARDLYRLAREEFTKPAVVVAYVAALLAVLLHLRHGIWSAFQSIGATRENTTATIYKVGGLLALVLGLGFIFIPVYVFFFGGNQ